MTLTAEMSRAMGRLAAVAHRRSIRADGFSMANPEPVWAGVANFLAETGAERVPEPEDQRVIDDVAARPDMIEYIRQIADEDALERLRLN